ncbi:polar amino acid ABC transporter ATP-binding protein [Candidatus Epulonipiscioides gigas]|nr:polar amino acid ABC transporter ATP-binding protein [Epulopiscium sp. SCG-C07WGA-EpuloA2]
MKIKIDSITKVYGKTTILDNISLDIDNINSLGIIGESGCGKSTLLRLLSGIEEPEEGEILINDISPIVKKKEFQSKIGVVFQKHNLFPHLSVYNNIALILHKIKKIDKLETDKKINALLKQLRISNEANKKPSEISGGQAQRASIARALSTNPSLIFLDEPTAALDPLMTQEVLKAITSLKKDGRHFIFVTHEMHFLKDFADYFIFLKQGKVIEQGDRALLNNPQSAELKEFLKIY